MTRMSARLGLTAAAIAAGSGVFACAQSSTTGAISGVVSDSSGNPLANVTIVATSAQISRTIVTGADGSFRIGLLNPGQWTLSLTKAGFAATRQQVNVVTNQTQPIVAKMAAVAQATVEVVATSGALDPSTTQQGQTFNSESIASLPTGRDFNSLAYLAPGVVTSGFNNSDPSVGGGSAAENSYIVDGLNTTDFRRGFQGQALSTEFIDQYEVQTGGFKPEFSALGGVFNAVTRSGSNEFKGSAWFTDTPRSLASERVKGSYARQPQNADRYDLGAWLGGAIQKDKLFYFLGVNYIDTKTPSDTNRNLLADGGIDNKQTQVLAKLNWYLAQDQQLTIFVNLNDGKVKNPRARPLDGDANFGATNKNTTQNFNLSYDWTISPSLFLSAKAGSTELKTEITPDVDSAAISNGNWYRTGPGFLAGNLYNVPFFGTSRAPIWNSGGLGFYTPISKNNTAQYKVDLSWFQGDHNLKFGISYLDSKYRETARNTGGVIHRIRGSNLTNLNLQDQRNSTDAQVENVFTAFYAQDSWSLFGGGFKLMYGFRYEKQELKDYLGRTYLKFDKFGDLVAPRVGFTWDIKKNGTMKLAGSYARYFESIPQRIGIRVFANETFTRTRYNTASGNPPGTLIYNFSTGAFTYSEPNNGVTDFSTPFSYDPIAEGTKLPERREFTLGFDWQFAPAWTAGLHGRYRKMLNPMEDSVISDAEGNAYPGDTQGGVAILWNPHPGPVTYRMQPFNGGGVVNAISLYPEAKNFYKSLDFTLDYKDPRLNFGFSYTWSRLEGNYEGLVSSSNGQGDNNITASYDYWPYVGYGLLPNDRTSVLRFYGAYRFVFGAGDLNLGWVYNYQSGTPISLFDEGSSTMGLTPGTLGVGNIPWDMGGYGAATPANGKLGQFGRTPNIQQLDLHLDFQMKAGKLKVIPSVDVINVTDAKKELTESQFATDNTGSYNPAWKNPLTWQTGRSVRFGVKLQF